MFFEKAPRPTQTLSGPIPTNLDSLLGGFEAAKYTGGGGRNSRAMVEAEVWQPILDELREYGLDFNNPGNKRFEYAFFPKFGQGSLYNDADQELNDIYNALEVNKFRLPEDLYNAAQPEAIKQAELEIIETYEQDLADMAQKNPSLMAGISRFGGAIGSSVYDPYVIAPMGGPIKSLWKTMLQNAVGGAGYGAASEIDVANWFNSLNKDYTFDQFVFNVTSQAAFGAALPGVAYGIGKGVKLTSEIAGLTNTQAREGWEAIRRSRPEAIPEEDNALANVLEVHDDVDQSNPLIGVDNFDDALARTEHELRTLEAQQAINTDQTLKISEQPAALVNPDVLTADLPNLDGRKFRFEVDQLEVDAKVFQFKSGGDELGVTERLLDIDEWNYDIANDIMVFETREGRLIIADGHQRLALAKRLMAKDPSLDIKLYGVVKREIDGYEPKTVMLDAALKNIAEATKAERANVIMDAAKVLKIAPERLEGIPPRSALYKVIQNLLKLDDAAFDLVDQGIIKEKYGALIGDIIADKDLHVSAVKVLKQTDPKTMDEAESIVRQVEASPKEVTEQVDLFGEELITESLFIERAKILHQALVRIRKDKSTFATINKNASKLEIEGNKIERQANQKRVQNDENAIAYLNAVANRKGPLSDALSAEAKTAKDTGNYREAVDRFIGHIRRSVEQGDFDRAARSNVASSSQPPKEVSTSKSEPQQAIDEFDEPGSEAARAETANLKDDIFEDLDAPRERIDKTVSPIEEDNVSLEEIRMPLDDDLPPDQLRAQVKALTDENVPIVKDLIARIDAKFGTKSGDNIKDLSKVTQKANRPSILAKKPWHKVSHIRDSYRFKTVIDDIRDVPAIFDELLESGIRLVKIDTGKLFNPKEWGWRIIAFDLRMPNGQLVEWYLPIRELEAQKKAKGHLLFEEWRNKTPEEILEQKAEYRKTILRSWKGYDDAFQSSLDRMGISREDAAASWSKAESSMLEAARKSPSSSGMITSAVVRSSDIQVPSRVRIAEEPSAQKSMAREVPSSISAKSVLGIDDTPTKDIADPASDIKAGQEVRYNLEEEIYVDLDGQGNLTLMKVKDVLDPIDKEDDFIKQLEICKL